MSKGGIAKPGKHTLPTKLYGTDIIPAALTPKEMVLTEKQQKAVAPIPGKEHMLRPDQLKAFKASSAWAKIPRMKYENGKGWSEPTPIPGNVSDIGFSGGSDRMPAFYYNATTGKGGSLGGGYGAPSLSIGSRSNFLSTLPFAGYNFGPPAAYPTSFTYDRSFPGGYAARAEPAYFGQGGPGLAGIWGVPGGGTFMGGQLGDYVRNLAAAKSGI